VVTEWTAPRGDWKALNHHAAKFELPIGFRVVGVDCTFSVGMRQVFEGNNDGIPDGQYWYNTAKVSYKF
jgi:hypothetical protein